MVYLFFDFFFEIERIILFQHLEPICSYLKSFCEKTQIIYSEINLKKKTLMVLHCFKMSDMVSTDPELQGSKAIIVIT